MESFPGSYMTSFPSLWSVFDESTGRVICELDNPMRDPGDGTIITATNISIITYAGDGLWRRQEDIYNPLRFVKATVKWCRKAEELGTLPDEAVEWRSSSAGRSDLTGHRRQRISRLARHPPTRRQRRRCARHGARRRQHDRDRRSRRHAVRRRHLGQRDPACGDGRRRRRVLLRRRHPRLATRPRAAVPHQRRRHPQCARDRERCWAAPVRLHQQLRHRRPQARADRHRGRHHRREGPDAVRPLQGPGRRTRVVLRTRTRPARCRDVCVDDVRRRRLGPDPARRDHRRRRVRQAAVRDGQDRARSGRCRRRRARADPGGRTRPDRRALSDLGEDDQQRRGRAHRGGGGRCAGAHQVDSAARVVCDGNARQREGQAARHRRTTVDGVAAA